VALVQLRKSTIGAAAATGTLVALKARRTAILQPLIAKCRGCIVKLMGNGVLMEFASALMPSNARLSCRPPWRLPTKGRRTSADRAARRGQH
jgi:hypothetical protein